MTTISNGIYKFNFNKLLEFRQVLQFIKYMQEKPRSTRDIVDDFKLLWNERKYIQGWICQIKRIYRVLGHSNQYYRTIKDTRIIHNFGYVSEKDLQNINKGENYKLEDLIIKIMKEEKRSTSEILTYIIENRYYFAETVLTKLKKVIEQGKEYTIIGGVIYLREKCNE